MTIQRVNNALIYCVSGDTKPSGYANNALAVEQDTGAIFRYNLGTTTWVLLIGATKTETLTGKTINAPDNTVTNIGDANTGTFTTTKISTTNKALLNTAIVYNDQSNTFGAFDQIFPNSRLKLNNPAGTYAYNIVTSAIAAGRDVTLPLLTGNDEFVMKAFGQTLTTKTINLTDNTVTDTSAATGDLVKHNGTKYVRLAKGTQLQVLRVASGGADLEWATISAYTENKGAAQDSGDATKTAFSFAHGAGGTPSWWNVMAKSADADSEFYVTAGATDLTVTYNFPPPTGTNNLLWVFRATI